LSPDGTRFVTASGDGTVRMWDSRTGSSLAKPIHHQSNVWTASFSPDGTRIVTASLDKTARVWDARTGEPLGTPIQHQEGVSEAWFSPDGARIVTASADKTARVWDARTGEPLGKPLQHQGIVTAASFSPDGTRIVTASWDKTARVWDAPVYSPKEAAQLADLTETVGGLTISDLGAAVPLPDENGRLSRLRAASATAPEGLNTVSSFARWLFSDPWTRTISPLSSVTVPQYICDAIRRGAVEEAQRAFPGHPLLRGAPTAESLPSECRAVDR
jgi:hypothetical protein